MNRLLFVGFVFVAAAWPQEFDLLLQGGRVMDPKSRLDAGRDVAIKGGKIAAIEPSIAAGVQVEARITSLSGIPNAIIFDISVGISMNAPFMLPVCKSEEIVSG